MLRPVKGLRVAAPDDCRARVDEGADGDAAVVVAAGDGELAWGEAVDGGGRCGLLIDTPGPPNRSPGVPQAEPIREAHILSSCTAPAGTPSANWRSCSRRPAPPSIAVVCAGGRAAPSRHGRSADRDGQAAGRDQPGPRVEAGLPTRLPPERRMVFRTSGTWPRTGSSKLLPGRQRRVAGAPEIVERAPGALPCATRRGDRSGPRRGTRTPLPAGVHHRPRPRRGVLAVAAHP